MADSDSFFDDDSLDDSFAGAPSEELLRESEGSFEDLDDMPGLDSDTPDAGISQEELIAQVEEEDTELVGEPSDAETETTDAAVAKPAKKKGRFSMGSFDASEITIFDAALLISLIFISLATLMMFFELRQFGNFPFDGFPWRTDKF